jgi:hypothetical protein
MKCPRCHAENDERLKFCQDCGAPWEMGMQSLLEKAASALKELSPQ